MHMMMNKKIVAWMMAFALLFTMGGGFPLTVSADGGNDWTDYYLDSSGMPLEGKLRVEIRQNGSLLDENNPLDPEKDIAVKVFLDKIPVKGDTPDGQNYISDGDYVDITFSENFRLINLVSVPDAKTKDGRLVAKMALKNDEESGNFPLKARITFKGDEEDNIYEDEEAGGVKADFSFSMRYDYDGGETEDGITYKISIFNKEYTIMYPPEYKIEKTVVKVGDEDDEDINFDTGEIKWQVKVYGSTKTNPDANLDLESYILWDSLTDVGAFVTGSFNVDGEEKEPEFSDNILKYSFGEGDKTPKTITFTTKIDEGVFYQNGKIEIPNTVQLKKGNEVKAEDGTTAVGGSDEDKWIDKTVNQQVYSDGKIDIEKPITWTVTVDPRGKTLKNAYILEEFPGGLKLKEDGTLDAVLKLGETVLTVDSNSAQYYEVIEIQTADSGAKYKIYLGELNTEKTLTIITYPDPDTIFTKEIIFTNKATLHFDDGPGNGIGSAKSVGIGTNMISKSHTGRDEKGIVTWKVNVNRQDQNNVTNPIAYDVLVYGKELTEAEINSAIVEGGEEAENQAVLSAIKNANATQAVYQKLITGSMEMEEGTTGLSFKVFELKKDGVAVADVLVVSGFAESGTNGYKFKTQLMDIARIFNGNPSSYYNYVHLFNGESYLSSASANGKYSDKWLVKEALNREGAQAFRTGNQSYVNANKNSSEKGSIFNYDDKSVVFRLVVDMAKIDLAHIESVLSLSGLKVTLTDTLPKDWEFLPLNGTDGDCYKIFKYSGGEANDNPLDEGIIESAIISNAQGENGQRIDFVFDTDKADFDNNAYVLVFRAGPNEAMKEDFFSKNNSGVDFTNNAKLNLEWNDRETNYGSEQKVTLKNKVLDKTKIGPTNGVIKWTIDYNPSNIIWPVEESSLEQIYLEDVLPGELQLRLDGEGKPLIEKDGEVYISCQNLQVGNDGTITPDGEATVVEPEDISYIYDEEKESFVLRFHISNNGKAYRFSYQTKIVGDSGSTVKNTVTLFGKTGGGGSSEGSYKIEDADSSAMANYFGRVEITKYEGNSSPMKDVVFELRNLQGSLVQTGKTNDAGKLIMRGIEPGTYTLVEITPAGYIEVQGYKVVVKENPGTGTPRMTTRIYSADDKLVSDNATINIKNYKMPEDVAKLTVKKVVGGSKANDEDREKNFIICIELTLKYGTTADLMFLKKNAAGITVDSGDVSPDEAGRISVNLKDKEEYVLYLPTGTGYKVVEDDDSKVGYNVSYTNGTGTLENDVIVTVNNNKSGGGGGGKPPTDPKDPAELEDPTDTENPEEPSDSEDTTDSEDSSDPEKPVASEKPRIPIEKVKNPNSPDSPDEFILIDEDGTPLGNYKKQRQPDGSYIYVDENGIPLGGLSPRTGDTTPLLIWGILMGLSLLGMFFTLIGRRRLEKFEKAE